jgi:hypothetical protein
MKKLLFLLLCGCSFLAADDGLYIHQNMDIGNGESILFLSDNTIWHLYPVRERWRTLSEWWNGVQIDKPEKSFLDNFDKWENGCTICIHPYDGRPLEKYNNENLKKCNYILELYRTDRLAFAQSVDAKSFSAFLPTLFKQKYKEGYNKGYNEGYNSGYSIGYGYGHSVGYSAGYNVGVANHNNASSRAPSSPIKPEEHSSANGGVRQTQQQDQSNTAGQTVIRKDDQGVVKQGRQQQ